MGERTRRLNNWQTLKRIERSWFPLACIHIYDDDINNVVYTHQHSQITYEIFYIYNIHTCMYIMINTCCWNV